VYVVTAKAMAEGRGPRLDYLPGAPLMTKYPLLWPGVLSGVIAIAGAEGDRLTGHLVVLPNAVLLPLALLAFAVILARSGRLPTAATVFLVLALGLNPSVLELARFPMSETLYLALTLGAIVFRRAETFYLPIALAIVLLWPEETFRLLVPLEPWLLVLPAAAAARLRRGGAPRPSRSRGRSSPSRSRAGGTIFFRREPSWRGIPGWTRGHSGARWRRSERCRWRRASGHRWDRSSICERAGSPWTPGSDRGWSGRSRREKRSGPSISGGNPGPRSGRPFRRCGARGLSPLRSPLRVLAALPGGGLLSRRRRRGAWQPAGLPFPLYALPPAPPP